MHPTEDDLVLHYYGEAGVSEEAVSEAGIDAHLAACGDCRDAFAALRRVMEAIDTAPVPEPGPGFERTVWARLQPALETRPAASRWSWLSPRGLAFAGGLAAVVIGVIVWQLSVPFAPFGDADTVADAEAHRERVLLTAVSDHIEQSELVLVELANAEAHDGGLDVSLERSTADDLVSAGRLYRETARQAGDLQLADLLEDLELVLVEIARGPEALSAQQLQGLRNQIDEQELIFKLRVLAADVRARQQSQRSSPGTSKRTL
jgi:type II secretory pathway component PulM